MGNCIGIYNIDNEQRNTSEPQRCGYNNNTTITFIFIFIYRDLKKKILLVLKFVLDLVLVENSLRKNSPLCHETIRWRSDVPLTQGQLRSKRDEFWETAPGVFPIFNFYFYYTFIFPAFDGRREIWDALKAASKAAESLDFVLAQAILDGANVSVPNG